MARTRVCLELTHSGALEMLGAAQIRASEIGVPANIVIVDSAGNDVACLRMDGALLLSMRTARTKARTSASHRCASAELDADLAARAARASGGEITNLAGGLPIFIDRQCVGGIGVGSGSDEEDVAIAEAGLAAIGAQRRPASRP